MILEYYLMCINNIYMSNNTKARDLFYQHVYNHIKENIDYFKIIWSSKNKKAQP